MVDFTAPLAVRNRRFALSTKMPLKDLLSRSSGTAWTAIMALAVAMTTQGVSGADTSIFISQDDSVAGRTVLTCSIAGPNVVSYRTYLYCPLSDTVCARDCTKECRYENGRCIEPAELAPIVGCSRRLIGDDHVQYLYTIDRTRVANKHGDWFCSVEGTNSKILKLRFSESLNNGPVAPVSTKKPQRSLDKPAKVNPPTIPIKIEDKKVPVLEIPKYPKPHQKDSETKKPSYEISLPKQNVESNDDFSFRILITKYQVVIGIICLLSISIVLNIAFCIRDSMVKKFIDNIKSNLASSRLLLWCICQNEPDSILATAKLDRILSKESDYISNNASNSSKNDIFHVDSQRPLIPNLYSNNECNLTLPSHITRSGSVLNTEMQPKMPSLNFDHYNMSLQRSYINPYVMTRSHLGSANPIPENQRHSFIYPFQYLQPNIMPTMQTHPSKKHGSENDIDLIRHCDSQVYLADLPSGVPNAS